MDPNTVLAFHLPRYFEIPDVGLYLKQVVKYINDILSPLGLPEMTASMISNYVKQGLIDKPVRKLITDNASSEEIKEYARKELGMLTLKESCMELIEQGMTTVEELVKVAYYD